MQPNEQTFCHVGNDSMKQVISLSLYLIFILPGCKRENTYQDCMPNVNTIDTLYNLPGTIVMIDSPAIYAIRIAEQMGNSLLYPLQPACIFSNTLFAGDCQRPGKIYTGSFFLR